MLPQIVCFNQTEKSVAHLRSFFQAGQLRTLPIQSKVFTTLKNTELCVIECDSGDTVINLLYEIENYIKTMKVCVISSEKSEALRLQWFSLGVDEYILKPYSLAECKLRLHRLLQYQKVSQNHYVQAGELSFLPQQGEVYWRGNKKQLRVKEAKILEHFFRYKNRVVTRDQLIDAVWPNDDEIPTYSTIDVYIRRIRMSMGQPGKQLQTIRGFGYILRDG